MLTPMLLAVPTTLLHSASSVSSGASLCFTCKKMVVHNKGEQGTHGMMHLSCRRRSHPQLRLISTELCLRCRLLICLPDADMDGMHIEQEICHIGLWRWRVRWMLAGGMFCRPCIVRT